MNSDFEDSRIATTWLEALPYHPIFISERLGETSEGCKIFILIVLIEYK
jgi:hypothetical protein